MTHVTVSGAWRRDEGVTCYGFWCLEGEVEGRRHLLRFFVFEWRKGKVWHVTVSVIWWERVKVISGLRKGIAGFWSYDVFMLG